MPGSSSRASASASGSIRSRSSHGTSARRRRPRAPRASIATPSARAGGPANRNASSDGSSSHCASSTTTSTGRSSAAPASRLKQSGRHREAVGGGRRPERQRARAARAPGPPGSRRAGRAAASRARPARRTGCRTRSRCRGRAARAKSVASPTAYRSSAVLPIPGGPCSSKAPLRPSRAASRSAFRRPRSSLRPTMVGSLCGTGVLRAERLPGCQVAVGRSVSSPRARRDLIHPRPPRPAFGQVRIRLRRACPPLAGHLSSARPARRPSLVIAHRFASNRSRSPVRVGASVGVSRETCPHQDATCDCTPLARAPRNRSNRARRGARPEGARFRPAMRTGRTPFGRVLGQDPHPPKARRPPGVKSRHAGYEWRGAPTAT